MICIDHDSHDPFFNHAVEEYLLREHRDEFFLLWRNARSILVGRNQNTRAEIDEAFAASRGIAVVRRLSGGGTVFCDPGNVNFTFIANRTPGSGVCFRRFAEPVAATLRSMGVPAEFSGRNDIVVNDRKISGNAQYTAGDRMLHHGTLLYAGDLAELAGALRSDPLKFQDKAVKSVRSRVANVSEFLSDPPSVEEFVHTLRDGVADRCGIRTIRPLAEEERQRIETYAAGRFRTHEWNYGASPAFGFNRRLRCAGGTVETHLDIRRGSIEAVRIFGDFFGEEDIDGLEALLRGLRHDRETIAARLESLDVTRFIAGITRDELTSALL